MIMLNEMVSEKSELDVFNELSQSFKKYFLSNTEESALEYQTSMTYIASQIATQIKEQTQPYIGLSPKELLEKIDELDLLPIEGLDFSKLMEKTNELFIKSNISVYHPHCLAHLHCPTFIISLVAEMIISAFNQSMDSWDQAPAASMLEQIFCDKICNFYGFDQQSDGVFTGGGTMSNFMGLLLARDRYSLTVLNHNIQEKGLPPEASRFRIICSLNAHFSIVQSASILGLGKESVVTIDSIEEDVASVEKTILALKEQNLIPIAYVMTAGTTDFGSFGKIDQISECVHKHGLWIHVDAAYGGALIFSEKHKDKLKGIEQCDSITIDFHKLFFQPISCGMFIVKDKNSFDYIKLHADYLNPESNKEIGILDLVFKSLQTTRRFDALKPLLTLQHIGIKKFGEMLDYTIDLADRISDIIDQDTEFELAYKTPINAVVFRYTSSQSLSATLLNELNDQIKTKLLFSGEAIIGQTKLNGQSFLKFTILNPTTSLDDILLLLEKIKSTARIIQQEQKN